MLARRGIIGGAIGGILMLLIDQSTYAIGISKVDTIGVFSKIFKVYGGSDSIISSCILFVTITGMIGWFVSSILADLKHYSFVFVGIVIGGLLWVAMNIIFWDSKIDMPPWSMGVGSLIINLISHLVLGLSITFSIAKFKTRVRNNKNT